MGILLILVGAVVVVGGVFANSFSATGMFSLSADDKSIPKWFGRLVFFGVGAVFIAVGLRLVLAGF